MNQEEQSSAKSQLKRPLPADVVDNGRRYSIAQRAQVLTLLGVQFAAKEVEAITQVPLKTIYKIRQKAVSRGWNPGVDGRVLDHFVVDGTIPGRPAQISQANEDAIIASLSLNRSGREKSAEVLAYEQHLSISSVLRILKKNGFTRVKPKRKPGLNAAQRKARLDWCLQHQSWTLEDWKNVIWSDETSVILGQRRGQVRLWRRPNEAFEPSCVRPRWKGFTEFLFWGCFTYDSLGPCHIWKKETAREKKAAQTDIDNRNRLLEPDLKAEWMLTTGLRRINLRRNPAGKKPVWRFTKASGKLVRDGKGGIDWYRYEKEILIPKLIPFARQCQQLRPGTIAQEDNAPAHAHPNTTLVYKQHDIEKMLWPGNSPDLNAIEKAWPWMKKTTTARGAISKKTELAKVWDRTWKRIPDEARRNWIEGIPANIQKVIALNGGNEYEEGRQSKRSYVGLRKKGYLSPHAFLMYNDSINTNTMPDSASWVDIEDGDNEVNDGEVW